MQPVLRGIPPRTSLPRALPVSTPAVSQTESEKLQFFESLEGLCNSPVHSDLRIHCLNSIFYAHHNILSLRTPFFANAVKSFSAGATGTVSLNSHRPETVLRFLKWCYTGEYPEKLKDDLVSDEYRGPKTHIAVYLLADFLGAEGLQKLAAHKYGQSESQVFDGKRFLESVRMVFENTVKREDLLRQTVLAVAVAKHGTMKASMRAEYEMLLFEMDEFTACLALKL